MKTNELPLTMHDEVIGTVVLDYDTGKLEGLVHPKFVSLLEELFGAGLMELTFMGKPGIPITREELNVRLKVFLEGVERDRNAFIFRQEVTPQDRVLEDIKVGQIWVEKHKRADYPAKRTLEIRSIEQKTISDQDGVTDITPITYAVTTKGFYVRQLSRRTMSTYILRQRWELVEG